MRGYGQFCPVALGAEVFAERWTPLILRELLAGSHRFSQLQRGLPGIPRALLTQRLGSLQRAGLIERRPTGAGRGWEYHLSQAGLSFRPVVEALHRAKGCRARTFHAGQTFIEFGPKDLNLTRNEAGGVTETVVTFLLPVGAPITVDAPAPRHCPL
jgi:DNA-binding HxlR family transcriptional regulator